MSSSPSSPPFSALLERRIVLCVGAVQFVNILDFMIVMPLGPDFTAALQIPSAQLGYIGGAYTAAASISGLVCAFFLDRFDRRKALSICMIGLVLGTLSGAFATNLATLMTARIFAGAFGGPATSLSYSIIADVIPSERRGRAMGAVMAAFSVASVLGVPAGLELAQRGGWQFPFIAVAVLGAIIGTYAHGVLPPMSGHLAAAKQRKFGFDLLVLFRTDVALSLLMTALIMASSFVVVPNISPYLQYNLHYPREDLGKLYLVGGVVSFIAMRRVGGLVDRFGSARIATFGALFVAGVVYAGFARVPPAIPVMAIFVLYMLGMAFRNVPYNTLTTKVPRPEERARFGSIQSSVQHMASALGAFASARMLTQLPEKKIGGMENVAYVSIALVIAMLPVMWLVERRVIRAASAASEATAAAPAP